MKIKLTSGSLIYYERKRFIVVPKGNWTVNRNTPTGDPADYYQKKPYGGRKYLSNPVAEIEDALSFRYITLNEELKAAFEASIERF